MEHDPALEAHEPPEAPGAQDESDSHRDGGNPVECTAKKVVVGRWGRRSLCHTVKELLRRV